MYPYGRTFLWLPILQNQGRETSACGRSPNLPEVLYISSMLAESGVHRVMAEWSPAGLFPSANLTLYNCTPAPTPRTVGHSWKDLHPGVDVYSDRLARVTSSGRTYENDNSWNWIKKIFHMIPLMAESILKISPKNSFMGGSFDQWLSSMKWVQIQMKLGNRDIIFDTLSVHIQKILSCVKKIAELWTE